MLTLPYAAYTMLTASGHTARKSGGVRLRLHAYMLL